MTRRTKTVLALLSAASLAAALAGTPATAEQSGSPGPNNDISDVAGLLVGHATDPAGKTGVTVVVVPGTGSAGVDVRGGAPSTRETDLLAPTNYVEKTNAILLAGGGEYGLAAGPGVMQWLAERNLGFQVGFAPNEVVPIVPGAATNDLRRPFNVAVRPDHDMGYAAAAAAAPGPVALGNVGAGAAAVAGGLKGGVGSASVQVAPGVVVAALVVVNSVGTPADLTSGCGLLGAQYGLAGEFAAQRPAAGCGSYRVPAAAKGGPAQRGSVIGVLATNVTLDKAMNTKVAEAAHDGVTRAIGPAHSMADGDTFFSVSTDVFTPAVGVLPTCIHSAVRNTALGCQVLYHLLINAAAEVVSRAITSAMLEAKTVPGLARSYCDTFAGACGAAAAPAASVTTTDGAAAPPPPAQPPAGGGLPWQLVPVAVLALLVGFSLTRWPLGRPRLRRPVRTIPRRAS